MTICFFMQDTGSVYGAERATLDLAQGLRRAGHDVLFLLIDESRLELTRSGLREALTSANFCLTPLKTNKRFDFDLIRAVRRFLVESRCSVLHTIGYKADLHGGFAAGWGRVVPVVGTVHGWLFRPDLKEKFYGWINLWALRRFTRVIALSHYYECYLSSKGIHAVRIPTGFEIPVIPESGFPATFTVGILGRFSEEKNHEIFLQVARILIDRIPGVRFLIAGDGPLRSKIAAMIDRWNLKDVVELAGYLPRDSFFQKIHVLAVCSTMENSPYSLLEAMAWGRPVVATEVGGIPDLVTHGQTGFMVPVNDAKRMAECIETLAKDHSLFLKLGTEARQILEQKFSLEQSVRSHIELYGSLKK